MTIVQLSELKTELTVSELLNELVPPREFDSVSLENYRPDPQHPSQKYALDEARDFSKTVNKGKGTSKGIYLDGGFGVGKTHLLASIFHETKRPKLFGAFISYTSILGYLGFQEALNQFSKYSLICIDEFELDDPGDTMLMSRMLKELSTKGIYFAATSNTPPNALGQGRFAADSFQREISSVAGTFEMVRIDGEDYRHRSANYVFTKTESSDVDDNKRNLVCTFGELIDFLSSIHQSRYAKLAEQFDQVFIEDVYALTDQFQGLRFVSFIDRCYEAGISLRFNGLDLSEVFLPEHVAGAYQKKYLRCRSRLYAMNSR